MNWRQCHGTRHLNTDLQPSAQDVLLKESTMNGFVFYTNYLSQKGLELAQNQGCALTFWWHILQQQVRIEGRVYKLDLSESYFRGLKAVKEVLLSRHRVK